MPKKWSELTPKEKQYGLIGVVIFIIFIAAIAVIDPLGISGGEKTTGDSLRARFTSWLEDFNTVKSDYNSLVQSWNDGVISSSW